MPALTDQQRLTPPNGAKRVHPRTAAAVVRAFRTSDAGGVRVAARFGITYETFRCIIGAAMSAGEIAALKRRQRTARSQCVLRRRAARNAAIVAEGAAGGAWEAIAAKHGMTVEATRQTWRRFATQEQVRQRCDVLRQDVLEREDREEAKRRRRSLAQANALPSPAEQAELMTQFRAANDPKPEPVNPYDGDEPLDPRAFARWLGRRWKEQGHSTEAA